MATNKKRATVMEDYGPAPENLNGHPFYGMELDDDQRRFADAIWNPDKKIIFANAVAGTGKTTVAMGVAKLLVQYKLYDGILCIASPCEESRQGYLPGDISQKSEVYFEPFYQAMQKCDMNPFTDVDDESLVNAKHGTAYVKMITHTYTRGSTFDRRVVIIDEMQNFTFRDAKKVLTRCTDNCKVICLGHDGQCDLPDQALSGFVPYLEHFRGQDQCEICQLTVNHRGWISSHADALSMSEGKVIQYRQRLVSQKSL